MKSFTEKHKVSVPPGISGNWEVKQFTVTEEQSNFDRIRGMFNGGRYTPAGTYTGLFRNKAVIMSDTPDEITDHIDPILHASGHVLINGLGLGVVLNALAKKENVFKITVIELSEDVIKLVWNHYAQMYGDKIEIIHADAFTYQPPKGIRYGFVWHDIWDNICGDNVEEMKKLYRKYGRKTDRQGAWCRYLCERANR